MGTTTEARLPRAAPVIAQADLRDRRVKIKAIAPPVAVTAAAPVLAATVDPPWVRAVPHGAPWALRVPAPVVLQARVRSHPAVPGPAFRRAPVPVVAVLRAHPDAVRAVRAEAQEAPVAVALAAAAIVVVTCLRTAPWAKGRGHRRK